MGVLTLPLQAAPFLAAKLTLALDAAPVVTVATIGFVAAVAVVVTVVGLRGRNRRNRQGEGRGGGQDAGRNGSSI
ncbi:MAG: hypothetical protein ACXWKT_18970, partial [Caulobacteraceae bacterium]